MKTTFSVPSSLFMILWLIWRVDVWRMRCWMFCRPTRVLPCYWVKDLRSIIDRKLKESQSRPCVDDGCSVRVAESRSPSRRRIILSTESNAKMSRNWYVFHCETIKEEENRKCIDKLPVMVLASLQVFPDLVHSLFTILHHQYKKCYREKNV